MLASPSGRSFGCAGTTPTARFRHSASMTDTMGGGHFPNAPQRQGFRWGDLNRQGIDASEDRAATLECGRLA